MTPFLVRVRFAQALRGGRGEEVHASSFLDRRLIVLDCALLARPAELKRIWIHELFHFVWQRMGNPRRHSWEALITSEMEENAPGELGWSAEWRKHALHSWDRSGRTRRWREYCCESFCDSAGWLLSGPRRHSEFTLGREHRAARRRWLHQFLRYNSG